MTRKVDRALPITIFIGSSHEGLQLAEPLAKSLRESDLVTVLFWPENVYRPAEYTMESLDRNAADVDLAVLVWSADDARERRIDGARSWTPRDNVVLEYGFFVGRLGRHRCLPVVDQAKRDDAVTSPTDVDGLSVIPVVREPGTRPSEEEVDRVSAKILDAADQLGLMPDRELASTFRTSQLLRPNESIDTLGRIGARALAEAVGLDSGFGLHLWLVSESESDGIALRRFARWRPFDALPATGRWREFRFGEGAVGRAWESGLSTRVLLHSDVDMGDMPSGVLDLTDVGSESDWHDHHSFALAGMAWPDLELTRSKFRTVVAVPIAEPDRGRIVGVLSANVGRSSAAGSDLLAERARVLMAEIAAGMWTSLPEVVRGRTIRAADYRRLVDRYVLVLLDGDQSTPRVLVHRHDRWGCDVFPTAEQLGAVAEESTAVISELASRLRLPSTAIDLIAVGEAREFDRESHDPLSRRVHGPRAVYQFTPIILRSRQGGEVQGRFEYDEGRDAAWRTFRDLSVDADIKPRNRDVVSWVSDMVRREVRHRAVPQADGREAPAVAVTPSAYDAVVRPSSDL